MISEILPATNGAETAQASPVEEPAEEQYVEISSELSPRVDVDSGYAVDDESPIHPAIDTGAKKRPRRKALSVRKEESDSFDLSGKLFGQAYDSLNVVDK